MGRELEFPTRRYDEGVLSFDHQCTWPWHSAYIDSLGNVVSCCYVADHRVDSFGNLGESTLAAVWNSPAYQEFKN